MIRQTPIAIGPSMPQMDVLAGLLPGLVVAGNGPDKPIARNDTSTGRAQNRGVALVKP